MTAPVGIGSSAGCAARMRFEMRAGVLVTAASKAGSAHFGVVSPPQRVVLWL
jgi:hypothetical protein